MISRNIGDLLGLTMREVSISESKETMTLITTDGREFMFLHDQSCCENVQIDDVNGDLSDLVGLPLCMCEEATNNQSPRPESAESFTWTFYKFATPKGYVNIKWLGTSNGCYSEDVSLYETERNHAK